MPLPREVSYWNEVSKHASREDGYFNDNVWKRPQQIRRLLQHEFLGQKTLEIGCGNGVIGGSLRIVLEGHCNYTATELSPNFRKTAKLFFNVNSVEADVTELPGSGYTRIIALDSLEHVRPADRGAGYKRISSVAAKDALLFIHYSLSISRHDPEFDHPFGLKDICALEDVGFALQTFERYDLQCGDEYLKYAFVVMKKT